MNLRARYESPAKPVVTAHRGFSGQHPENTLLAFSKAYELGVDCIEFDVRESSDGELIIIHDATLDRTTNGTGRVDQNTISELKRLNASYWQGPHDSGRRLSKPSTDVKIPMLEEVLTAFAGKVGLNIQVYADRQESLERIVQIYNLYDLRSSAFLMLRTFAEGALVRAMSPDVAVCIGEDRANLDRHLSFGVDFIQPTKQCLTDKYIRRLAESGIPANVFFANDQQTMAWLIEQNLSGIMTDVPDVLVDLMAARQQRKEQGRILNRIEQSGSGDA